MDSMDHFQERCEALDQQMKVMGAHTPTVERRRRWWRSPCRVAAVIALGFPLGLPLLVQAKTFHCGSGDVPCLIAAINDANANGQKNTIRLEAGTYTLPAPDNGPPGGGGNGLPVITSALTVTGQGAETTIIERGTDAPRFRILSVAGTGTLTLKRLTLRGGFSFPGGGGGINNSGTLALVHTTIANNSAPIGGGILTFGPVTITHSIIADNSAVFVGGGLRILGPGTVTLTATTVTRNSADGGGGLAVAREGPLGGPALVSITESTIANNTTEGMVAGGGMLIEHGTVVITNTTIAANTVGSTGAGALGGGIVNFRDGTVLLLNSTLVDNSVVSRVGSGGGISNSSTMLLQNTLLARNTAGLGPDCSGSVTSLGTNLIGDPTGCTITLRASDLTGDPGLGPFTDNGKPGNGHFPLLPTSQAIDAGNDAICPRTDQLGRRRIGPCDIGAIEFPGKHDRPHDAEDDHHDKDNRPHDAEDDHHDDDEHHDRDHAAAAQ